MSKEVLSETLEDMRNALAGLARVQKIMAHLNPNCESLTNNMKPSADEVRPQQALLLEASKTFLKGFSFYTNLDFLRSLADAMEEVKGAEQQNDNFQ